MTGPEICCGLCGWHGPESDLVPNYVSARACPRCKMAIGIIATAATAEVTNSTPPSILDAAIAGSTSIDPAGSRKPAEQLMVPTAEERQAVQDRRADYFRKNGVL